MYSPKISENLIPVLYHTAKARGVRMTGLVDRLLYRALALEPMPAEAFTRFRAYRVPATNYLPAFASGAAFGTAAELTQIFHSNAAHPFRDPREVEAWYSSSIHGFCRALELILDRAGEDPSREPDKLEFFRRLSALRIEAHRMLTQPAESLESACAGVAEPSNESREMR